MGITAGAAPQSQPGPPGRAGVTSSIRRSLGEKCALRQIPADKSGSRKRDFVEGPLSSHLLKR